MDDIDRKIISLLTEDARMPATEIGRQVGRSRVAVADRIERLLDAGEIARFTICRPPLPCRALYEIALSVRGSCDGIISQLGLVGIVTGAWSVAGSSDLFIMLEADSVEEIHALRLKLTAMVEVARVTTHVITRSFR